MWVGVTEDELLSVDMKGEEGDESRGICFSGCPSLAPPSLRARCRWASSPITPVSAASVPSRSNVPLTWAKITKDKKTEN